MRKNSIYPIILTLCIILASCNSPTGQVNNNRADLHKAIDKQVLVTMISSLHKALNVKDYSIAKGIAVLKPYTLKYKVCIPGFTDMVPYDESYLYIYCIYDTKKIPPRVLSFRFQLPKRLAREISVNDISKPFTKWQKKDTFNNGDNTITNSYIIGEHNTVVHISQPVLPDRANGVITDITFYR